MSLGVATPRGKIQLKGGLVVNRRLNVLLSLPLSREGIIVPFRAGDQVAGHADGSRLAKRKSPKALGGFSSVRSSMELTRPEVVQRHVHFPFAHMPVEQNLVPSGSRFCENISETGLQITWIRSSVGLSRPVVVQRHCCLPTWACSFSPYEVLSNSLYLYWCIYPFDPYELSHGPDCTTLKPFDVIN